VPSPKQFGKDSSDPFSEPGEDAVAPDLEASTIAEEAYVLTREGAVALGVDKDGYP